MPITACVALRSCPAAEMSGLAHAKVTKGFLAVLPKT